MSAGLKPVNAFEFNQQLGLMLRKFIDDKNSVSQWRMWIGGVDLTKDPYLFSDSDQALIKSAINDLDNELDTINMTFINQLAGPF